MTDKSDRKIQSVALARYQYRHEAEFAAGFLEEAGIPYRLQVDDAGMGLTVSVPATIWVRGMDVREASEILDLPDRADALPPGRAAPPPDRSIGAGRDSEPTQVVARSLAGDTYFAPSRLSEGERLLAFLLLVGDLGAVSLTQGAPYGPVWLALLVAIAGPLASGAFTGRTLAPIRRLLRAISGGAP